MKKTMWKKKGTLLCITAVLLCVPAANLTGQETAGLDQRLTEARIILEDGYQVTGEDLQSLNTLYEEIAEAGLDEHIPDIRMLLFIAGEKYNGSGNTDPVETETGARAVSPRVNGHGVSLTVSAVSAGLFNLFWMLGDHYHSKYTQAETPFEASRLMPYWQTFDLLTFISAGVSVLSFGIALPQLSVQPLAFAVAEPPGKTVQQQVAHLLKTREQTLRKRARADRGLYTLGPQVLAGTGLTFLITEALLFTMGTQVYKWNVSDFDYNGGVDPVSFSGMVFGIAGSSFLVSSLVAALLNPPPLSLETALARSSVELGKRDYSTLSLEEEDRGRLILRQEVLLEKLERGEAARKWHTPVVLSAAGTGIASLAVMGALLYTRENAEEALREGSTWDGITPSDGWIIGTGVAGGALLSAAGVLLTVAPRLKKIQEELDFIENRLLLKK